MLELLPTGLVTAISAFFLGNSLSGLFLFAVSILLSIALGKIFYHFFKKHAEKIREKTKHRLEAIIVRIIDKPLLLMLFLAGFAIGLRFLSIETGLLSLIYSAFWAIMTLLSAWIVIRIIDSVTKEYIVPLSLATGLKIDDSIAPALGTAAKIIVITIATTIILTIFGYNVTAILAGLGIGGIAIAFAAQQTIADIFGGVSILTSRPFRIGDTILVEGITGTVKKVGLRTTKLTGLDKSEITFSNAKLANAIIRNLSTGIEQRVELNLGLTYNTPKEKIQLACDLVKNIIFEHPQCANNPMIYFSDFKDYYLNILVIYFITHKDWVPVRHEINLKIKEAFDKNKIDFAFPTQTIHMAK